MITPNLAEFEAVAGPCADEAQLVEHGQQLIEQLQLDALLITRGERTTSRGVSPGSSRRPRCRSLPLSRPATVTLLP